MHPKPIQKLIDQFAKLPSIGPKTAERLVFYLLKQPKQELQQFGEAIEHIKESIITCHSCFNFAETDPCHICNNKQRDHQIICVVAKPQDILVIEKTNSYQGLYYVLGNNLLQLSQDKQDRKLQNLINKIKNEQVKEIIIALNPDNQGEATAIHLKKILTPIINLKMTRLARGLPMGADIEYADDITIENALLGRQELK